MIRGSLSGLPHASRRKKIFAQRFLPSFWSLFRKEQGLQEALAQQKQLRPGDPIAAYRAFREPAPTPAQS